MQQKQCGTRKRNSKDSVFNWSISFLPLANNLRTKKEKKRLGAELELVGDLRFLPRILHFQDFIFFVETPEMDEDVVQRVFQEGGRDYFQQQPSTSSSSSSILQSLPLHVSFDHGYYLLVKSIQELREKKEGIVTVGIGGPSGSGKTSLAEKVASVIGCTVVSMENYRDGFDEGNDLGSIDFDMLVRNLEDLTKGEDTLIPVFDYQQKKRVGSKTIKSASSGVVIVDGTYALHAKLRSLLDIRVAVVGGVHFSLLSKVRYDIGDSCSLDYLIDSIFPLFRKHIEPDLHHAQIRINNSFVSSFREAIYKLKCRSEAAEGHFAYAFQGGEPQIDNFIEMYLRPPSASEEARINDWIKVRQSGIRYYLSLGDQRIVDKNFIIRPKAEFEVGRMTLGGLLALGYVVVVSYKRASKSVDNGNASLSLETIDSLGETFMVLRGTNRKTVGTEALKMGITEPWITKSYLEMILESKGVPRLNTPPLLPNTSMASNQDKTIVAPRPIRVPPNLVTRLEDLSQPWTRSPTKSKMEPILATWHFISSDPSQAESSTIATTDPSSFRDTMQLAPMPDSYDLDRGLLLAVQAIQALLENKGFPVIVGIVRPYVVAGVVLLGGPSGSGKTSLAHKMANIVGCEVISLESYYKSEQVKDFKYDDFSSLDMSLLSKIIFEGVYALHPHIRKSLDLWIAVVGGVHSHLISRVQRDKSRVGCFMSQNEIMMTVFPMFQQFIEPHLVHAHLKIRNDFDPVLSPESSLFVLKSNKQILVEVDHLQDAPNPYLQIKGVDKDAVAAAGSTLKLDDSYTTKSYLQIVLERLPALGRGSGGIHAQQAARLQELVEFIQSQGSSSASESSPIREVSPVEGVIEDIQSRIRRLERWHTINTVLPLPYSSQSSAGTTICPSVG
ncbi:hypothetical protein C1H46_042639 [Malus baccata]|uniref:AAA+ ATPase domain-containing protein n=1 Tax=Malus baccata TaxID=106549 RepID=A0A540KC61_MALBA|nr:hypothetical protein C1H46_042639 [Malus baccata]